MGLIALPESGRAVASALSSRFTRFGFAALALGLIVQLGLVRLEAPLQDASQRALAGDEKRYVEVATEWSRGRFLELDPLWPPGYPAFAAAVLAAGGSPSAILWLQWLSLVGAGWALARIARRLGVGEALAAASGAWLLCDPQIAIFARLYRPEAVHLALLLVALLWALELRAELSPAARSRRLVGLGAVLGATVALKSLLLPWLPLFLLFTVRRGKGISTARQALLFLAPCALWLVGIGAFHRLQTGSWTLGGSARFNLWVGLNDRATRSLAEDRTWDSYLEYRASGGTFAERQAYLDRKLGERWRETGPWTLLAGQFPRQFHRLFDRESYFSAMLPPRGSRFLVGEGYGEAPGALTRSLAALEEGLYGVLIVLAPLGLAHLLRTRRDARFTIGPLFLGQLALYWFVHVKSRYRLTLLPILVLGAAVAVETLVRPERRAAVTRAEIAFGIAGTAALAFFAFGAG